MNRSGPPQAQVDSVIALYSQGQVQEALSTSETLVKDYPNTPLLYNNRSACHKALGQLEAAVKCYEQALALKPDYAEAHYNLANTFRDLGQFDAAVKRYEQALAIKPDYTEAYNKFSIATDMDVYFCHPSSPWQRGIKENTNGLLGQYFPKKICLSKYTQSDLNKVAAKLNNRPRKTLGFYSPSDKLNELLQ